MILSLSLPCFTFYFISSFPTLQLSPIIVLYRAPLLPSHVHRAFSPVSPGPSPSLRPTSFLSCPSSSSLHSLSRLSVFLPSFLRPSSFHLLPPFSPLSFPPLPFLPYLSLSVSPPVPSSLSHLLISLRTSGMRGLFIQERSLRRWPRPNGRHGAIREATRKDFRERRATGHAGMWPSTCSQGFETRTRTRSRRY